MFLLKSAKEKKINWGKENLVWYLKNFNEGTRLTVRKKHCAWKKKVYQTSSRLTVYAYTSSGCWHLAIQLVFLITILFFLFFFIIHLFSNDDNNYKQWICFGKGVAIIKNLKTRKYTQTLFFFLSPLVFLDFFSQNHCKLVAGKILQVIVNFPMLKKNFFGLTDKKNLSDLT